MNLPHNLHGFVFKDAHEYKQLKLSGYLYQNEKFGCPFCFLTSEDTNNFFTVQIRTMPENNIGIPHMLEHLILYGSKKYPIRNIFQELGKRTYSTDLNAVTNINSTYFHLSSTNQKDLLNNLDVCLDCVFHPSFSEVNFMSECHHLQFKDGDINKPLIHSGVIYNEIVDDYSYYVKECIENLYQGTPSAFEFGGTPEDIPKATYDQVIKYHQKYYHPSNSFFFFYCNKNFPIEQIFQKVSEIIDQFPVIKPSFDPKLFQMEPWASPKSIVLDYPSDERGDLEGQQTLSIFYVINEPIANDDLMIGLEDLVSILGNTNNSPLYQALVVPEIVQDISMEFNDDNYDPSISIIAEGFPEEKSSEIEQMIFSEIKKFSEDTSEKVESEIQSRLAASYHRFKLYNKEITNNFGMSLFETCSNQWIFGSNPLQLLDWDENLERSFKTSTQKGYLQTLAKKYLIENNHCLITKLNLVDNYQEKKIKEEKKKLNEIKKSLTKEQVNKILKNMDQISIENKKEQPYEVLPIIHRSEISRDFEFKEADVNYSNQIFIFNNPTNGLIYIDVIVTCDECNLPYLWLIDLVNLIVSSVGAGPFNEFKISKYKQNWFLSSNVNLRIKEESRNKIQIHINGSALNEDFERLVEMLKFITTEIHFKNLKKIKKIIENLKDNLNNDLIDEIKSYSIIRAAASINKQTAFSEAIFGLSGYNKIYDFITKKSTKEIAEKCETLFNQILTNGTIKAFVSCSDDMNEKVISKIDNFIQIIQKVQKIEYTLYDYSSEILNRIKSRKTFFDVPIQSGTVCFKKFCNYEKFQVGIHLKILSKLLTNEALHPQIRGKLGAYLVVAEFSIQQRIFTIYTEGDGVPCRSCEMIKEIIEKVESYVNDEAVESAVVSILKYHDQPELPALKGIRDSMSGLSKEKIKANRDVYFEASADDLRYACKYLTDGEFNISIAASRDKEEPPDGFDVVEIK